MPVGGGPQPGQARPDPKNPSRTDPKGGRVGTPAPGAKGSAAASQRNRDRREQLLLKMKGNGTLPAFLKNQGYRVWAGADKRINRAVELFAKGGKGNVSIFNKQYPKAKPKGGPGGAGAAGGAGAGASKDATVGGLSSPFFTPYADNMAQAEKLFDPASADALAGAEFDPQIRDLGIERQRAPVQTEQNIRDIKNWYGQALGHLETAGERTSAATDAGVSSVQDAVAKIVASLGGASNEGAGLVGAAGADAVGTLQALGTAQEQYNTDLDPLLRAESAGARTREQSMGTTRLQDLVNKITGLEGQRGQREAGYEVDIKSRNNDIRNRQADRLLKIREANNSLGQQGFQNDLSLANLDLAAQLNEIKLMDAYTDAQGAGKDTSYAYAKAPATAKTGAYNQALASIYDAEKEGLRVGVPRAVQIVNQILAGYGWSRKNPAVMALRNQILQDAGITADPRWR